MVRSDTSQKVHSCEISKLSAKYKRSADITARLYMDTKDLQRDNGTKQLDSFADRKGSLSNVYSIREMRSNINHVSPLSIPTDKKSTFRNLDELVRLKNRIIDNKQEARIKKLAKDLFDLVCINRVN